MIATRDLPISLKDPDTGERLFNYDAKIPAQNFSQALDMSAVRAMANAPIANVKAAANSAMIDSMTDTLLAINGGSYAGYKLAAPMLDKIMGGRVAAAEQDANIQNEMTKRRNMVDMLDVIGKQENAMNFGIMDTALKGLTGLEVGKDYANMTWVNPTTELGVASKMGENQGSLNSAKATRDNQMAIVDKQIAAASMRGGGSGGSGGSGGGGIDLDAAYKHYGNLNEFHDKINTDIWNLPMEMRPAYLKQHRNMYIALAAGTQGIATEQAVNNWDYLVHSVLDKPTYIKAKNEGVL